MKRDNRIAAHHRTATCLARSLAAVLLVACVASPVATLAADKDDLAHGQQIWAEKAQCQECHGWAGDGHGGLHSEGHAPSLRLTQLSRDQIRETIQCGRPSTPMPHFDRFAYTDKRCYDMTADDLGDAVPNRAPVTLQPYEIDALADYVATKVRGAGPVTRAQCIEFFGEAASSRCNVYAAQ